MAEEHPAGNTFVQRSRRLSGRGEDQPDLGYRPDHRRRVRDGPGPDGQARRPGRHRIADRGGQLPGAGGEHLGDEKRVPSVLPCKAATSISRPDISTSSATAAMVSSGSCIRVTVAVVASSPIKTASGWFAVTSSSRKVATTSTARPSIRRAMVADQVQSRLISPVEVLQQPHGRRPSERGTHPRVQRHAIDPDRLQVGFHTNFGGDVDQWSEGTRRSPAIAAPDQEPCMTAQLPPEPVHERGLSGTRFAEEHYSPAAGPRLRPECPQRRQLRVSLQKPDRPCLERVTTRRGTCSGDGSPLSTRTNWIVSDRAGSPAQLRRCRF